MKNVPIFIFILFLKFFQFSKEKRGQSNKRIIENMKFAECLLGNQFSSPKMKQLIEKYKHRNLTKIFSNNQLEKNDLDIIKACQMKIYDNKRHKKIENNKRFEEKKKKTEKRDSRRRIEKKEHRGKRRKSKQRTKRKRKEKKFHYYNEEL